jgi:hypothetical protein
MDEVSEYGVVACGLPHARAKRLALIARHR